VILKIFIVCCSLLIIRSESSARLAKKLSAASNSEVFTHRICLLHGDNLLHFNGFCFIDYSIVFIMEQKRVNASNIYKVFYRSQGNLSDKKFKMHRTISFYGFWKVLEDEIFLSVLS
jgi:hypothetical protein